VQFRLLEHAGHLPQLETPGALIHAVWSFADAHAASKAAPLNTGKHSAEENHQ